MQNFIQLGRSSIDHSDYIFQIMASKVVILTSPLEGFQLGSKKKWC